MLAGATAAKPNKTPPSTPSRDLTNQDNTQIVIANGNHTINPVSMYFLKGTETPSAVEDKIRNRMRLVPPQRVVLRPVWRQWTHWRVPQIRPPTKTLERTVQHRRP
jgi:hypothetical protein